jgi:hypothetical protein
VSEVCAALGSGEPVARERHRLQTLLAANKPLNTAYVSKEQFGQLWQYQREPWARKFFDQWRRSLRWQRLKPFERFAARSLAAQTSARSDSSLEKTLVALERDSWRAWKARDSSFFARFLSDDHVELGFRGPASKSAVVATVGSPGCVVQSYSVDRFTATRFGPDVAMLTYHAAQETTCNGAKVPSPVWVSSLYIRRNGKWLNAAYQQSQEAK